MTTKEQERKALEQIRKIVDGLGKNSYIGIAFEGCFEIAEENIENDWGCSMKERAVKAEIDYDDMHSKFVNAAKKVKELEAENLNLRNRLLTPDDLADIMKLLTDEIAVTEQNMKQTAEHIVEMADAPQDIGFLNAVKRHRSYQKKIEHIVEIVGRVDGIFGAYGK